MQRKRRDTMTPTRAAKVFGVHRSTIYRWCRKSLIGIATKLDIEVEHELGKIKIKRNNDEKLDF